MASTLAFLTRTRAGKGRMDWTDWLTYGYLMLGILLMFGPVGLAGAVILQDRSRPATFPAAFPAL